MEQTNIAPASQPSSVFSSRDFFSFRTMITLQIIQIVYGVVAVLITLASLATMFGGHSHDSGFGEFGGGGGFSFFSMLGGGGFFGGLIMLIVGNVGWRIWCELIIIFFRINKTLNNIEINTKV